MSVKPAVVFASTPVTMIFRSIAQLIRCKNRTSVINTFLVKIPSHWIPSASSKISRDTVKEKEKPWRWKWGQPRIRIRYFYVTYQKESSSRQIVTTSSRFCFCRAFLCRRTSILFQVAVRLPRFDFKNKFWLFVFRPWIIQSRAFLPFRRARKRWPSGPMAETSSSWSRIARLLSTVKKSSSSLPFGLMELLSGTPPPSFLPVYIRFPFRLIGNTFFEKKKIIIINMRKCHAHFPFFFRSGASKWIGNLVGRPQQVCFSFESQHFNFFFLLLLLIFTFLFNYNAYYTRVYIDAPPTFFGTTKAIRFFFFPSLSRAKWLNNKAKTFLRDGPAEW